MPTVLVIEDDAQITDLLASVLVTHGFRVVAAAGAAQALDVLRRASMERPAVVLLDVKASAEGLAFLEARTGAPLAEVPVVVMSAGAPLPPALLSSVHLVPRPVRLPALIMQLREVCAVPAMVEDLPSDALQRVAQG